MSVCVRAHYGGNVCACKLRVNVVCLHGWMWVPYSGYVHDVVNLVENEKERDIMVFILYLARETAMMHCVCACMWCAVY